jgi:putative ABC transport system permease protein
MTPEFPLVWRALRRHRIICTLLLLQVVIASAVLANGLTLVAHRFALSRATTGLDDARLVELDVEALQDAPSDLQRSLVLERIAALPGVDAVAVVNATPLSGRRAAATINRAGAGEDTKREAALYAGSAGFLDTMGVRIIAGRGFADSDFSAGSSDPVAAVSVVVPTRALADKLGVAPGDRIEVNGRALTVVGVAADVLRPSVDRLDTAYLAAFVPSPPLAGFGSQRLLARVAATAPATPLEVSEAASRATPPTFIWSAESGIQAHDRYFEFDRALARMALGMVAVLALVAAIGIGGLSSYWVGRRARQVAIRRALGATRAQIAWYFRSENLLLMLVGGVAGAIATVLLNIPLMHWLDAPPVPAIVLLASGAGMVVIGQAALAIALRRTSAS